MGRFWADSDFGSSRFHFFSGFFRFLLLNAAKFLTFSNFNFIFEKCDFGGPKWTPIFCVLVIFKGHLCKYYIGIGSKKGVVFGPKLGHFWTPFLTPPRGPSTPYFGVFSGICRFLQVSLILFWPISVNFFAILFWHFWYLFLIIFLVIFWSFLHHALHAWFNMCTPCIYRAYHG